MRIKYVATGKISLSHPYFADGHPQGLQWLIPDTTREAWRSRKVKTVRNAGGLSLFTSLDGDDNPVVDPGSYAVQIGLKPEDSSFFMAVTDLNDPEGEDWATGKVFLLHNRDQATATLDYSLIDGLRGSNFRYEFPFTGTDPGTLSIKDSTAAEVYRKEDLLPDTNNRYSIGLELRLAPGLYTFESSDGSTTGSQEFYLHDELARSGVPGLIEYHHTPAALAAYDFAFVRSSYKWYYHVVKRSAAHLADYDLSIVDGLANSPVAPYVPYTFAELTPEEYEQYQHEDINGMETLVFVSNAAIPFYERPKTHLQLVKTLQQGGGGGGGGGGPGGQQQGTTIIPHLPNPPRVSTGRDHAIIYVYV